MALGRGPFSDYLNDLSDGIETAPGEAGSVALALRDMPLRRLSLSKLRPVATNCNLANVRTSSNFYVNSSSVHRIRGNHEVIYPVFPAWYVSTAGDKLENGGGNAGIRASVKYPGATLNPVDFEDGDPDGMIASGSIAIGRIEIEIADGDPFFMVSDVVSPSGIIFFNRRNATAGFEEGLTASTTILASAAEGHQTPETGGSNCYRPVAILAESDQKGFMFWGNSHGYGTGDAVDSSTNVGAMARAIGSTYGYINLCIAGDTTARLLTSYRRRAMLAATCTHFISTPPDNDIGSGSTADQVKTMVLTQGRIPELAHTKRFLENHRPRTDASNVPLTGWGPAEAAALCNLWYADGMPTADGIAPSAVGASGVLRCGDEGHPWDGVIDVATPLAGSLTALSWANTGYTTDWVHADAEGVAALVASGAYNAAKAA